MSELPGTSAVSIESVEWAAESGGNLNVRITGRWRRRRPVSTGQPTLVIEAEGRRHRYPAMPEPPSVGGTGPGVWRLSFTIPGWMAPDLGRTWLQFGTVIVPLPVAVPAPGESARASAAPPAALRPTAPASGSPPSGSAPSGSSPRSSPSSDRPPPAPPPQEPDRDEPEEPPDFEPARGVAELTQRVDALEDELRQARAVRDELVASLEERERTRRIAEQRAHAEQALRRDLARQLSSSAQEAERARQAMGDLAAAEERIRGLEQELQHARRRSDEAEQVAAAATAARQRAERERELAEHKLQHRAEAGSAEAARLRFEQELRGRRAGQAIRVPAEPVPGAPPAVQRPVIASEPTAMRAAALPLPRVPPRPPAPTPSPAPAPAPAPTLIAAPSPRQGSVGGPATGEVPADIATGLRTELEARARADAALRARLIDAESRLAARVVLERRTSAVLAELRAELDSLGGELARERTQRVDAERRAAELERELRETRGASRGAHEAIGELREALARMAEPPAPEAAPAPPRAPEPEPAPPAATHRVRVPRSAPAARPTAARQPTAAPRPTPVPRLPAAPGPAAPPVAPPLPVPTAAAVEPARLNDALTRLRESIAPHDAPPPPAPSTAVVRSPSMHEALTRPSLEPAFRRMARTDPDAAGRLLLDLLPLQRVVYPHAVAYDLVLAPDRCVWVSVPNGAPTIEVQSAPRPRQEVDFQVVGEPARIARLLTAGRVRRLLRRGTARVRGRREGLAALSSLLGAPLDLGALHRAGVRPDPLIAFELLAAMIDPAWTATERFTVAHAPAGGGRTYLIVGEGRPLSATRIAPESGPSTTIHCATDDLLATLAGEAVPGVRVDGDVGAYLSLRKWIKRAQSE
jgi:hypothetical protein